VLENERQLRGLLGLPIDDCTRLMPSDAPTLAPFKPDWCSAVQECLANRPELFILRQEVKVQQMNLIRAKNYLLPDVRFTAQYDFNALGSRLDGPNGDGTQVNAFRNLADANFSSYSLGIRASVPIGYRLAHAQVRQAQLVLARSLEQLHDQETKAVRFLAQQYRRISVNYELIRANRAQREAFGEQLRARFQEYLAGRGTLDILLEAQRFWAQALSAEYNAIADYNVSIAGFEFAKGTIQRHDNVSIAEGPLPPCAKARAVEHERERTASLLLRERSAVLPPSPTGPFDAPAVGKVQSLPGLMQATPPLKEVPTLPGLDKPGAPIPELTPFDLKSDQLPATAPLKAVDPASVLPSAGTPAAAGAPRKARERNKASTNGTFGTLREGSTAPTAEGPTGNPTLPPIPTP
jgi:hypothetical protein